jgi:hypothetical protein
MWFRKWSRSGFLRQRIPGLHNAEFPQVVYLTTRQTLSTTRRQVNILSTPATCLLVKCFQPHQLASEVTSLLNNVRERRCYSVTTKVIITFTCGIFTDPVGNKVVASVCTSAPFTSRGKHPPLTGVCQVHQPWGRGSKMQGISYALTPQERFCSMELVTPPATPVFRVNVTVIQATNEKKGNVSTCIT